MITEQVKIFFRQILESFFKSIIIITAQAGNSNLLAALCKLNSLGIEQLKTGPGIKVKPRPVYGFPVAGFSNK